MASERWMPPLTGLDLDLQQSDQVKRRVEDPATTPPTGPPLLLPHPPADLTLNRKSPGGGVEGGSRGGQLPCEDPGRAGPGLGITYQRPRPPNQPRLDSLAPDSAYVPQTATRAPRQPEQAPPPPSRLTPASRTAAPHRGGGATAREKEAKQTLTVIPRLTTGGAVSQLKTAVSMVTLPKPWSLRPRWTASAGSEVTSWSYSLLGWGWGG